MVDWIRSLSRCQRSTVFLSCVGDQKSPIMIPRSNLILVVVFGMVVALIATLLPNLTGLFSSPAQNRRQLSTNGIKSLTVTTDSSSNLVKRGGISPQAVNTDLQVEALSAIHLALDMLKAGKLSKAYKLYKHALNLDSTHPDILNEYGEFLEKYEKDILTAEHMYSRALTSNPEHSKALANRKRTAPLVQEHDQSNFNRIDKKRDHLFQIPDSHAGMRRMKKESYFQHIHHSTAIEGNTFTLSQTRALVETRLAIGGKSIMEHNEILGMDAALSYVNNTLIRRIGAITKEDILDIHKRVLGFVDPIEAGTFRNTQVFVGDFRPPAASELEELMDEFIEWVNAEDSLQLHPVEHAALAHYKLVIIHPFYDGNGRTARLLMNLILMQSGFPPIIIKAEEKHQYYKHIDTANKGDVRPFIRFVAKCTELTLDDYLIATSEVTNTTLGGLLSRPRDDGRTIIIENEEDES